MLPRSEQQQDRPCVMIRHWIQCPGHFITHWLGIFAWWAQQATSLLRSACAPCRSATRLPPLVSSSSASLRRPRHPLMARASTENGCERHLQRRSEAADSRESRTVNKKGSQKRRLALCQIAKPLRLSPDLTW